MVDGFNKMNFDNIKTFILFVGNGRTGHSFIGSALSAHKSICITHESNALNKSVSIGNKFKLFEYMFKHNNRISAKGRYTPNRFGECFKQQIEGQVKENSNDLLVIGNKNAGVDTGTNINTFKSKITRFEQFLKPIDLKFICVIRNPFDTQMTIPSMKTTQQACDYLKDRVHILKYEDFILDPKKELSKLLSFLEVEINNDYLSLIESHTMKKCNKSRYKFNKTKERIEKIENALKSIPMFSQYSYED